jgi:DNA-binding protein HU-beta
LNKADLVDRIVQKTGLAQRDVRTVVDAIFDPEPGTGLIAAELLSGGKVAISGFGTFEARERKARTGRNPHTGESVDIPATRAPAFKAGKPLKESLKG